MIMEKNTDSTEETVECKTIENTKQNSDTSVSTENEDILNENPIEISVEKQMEELHDNLSNNVGSDIDNTVNINLERRSSEQITEDLQDILGGNDKQILNTNKTIIPSSTESMKFSSEISNISSEENDSESFHSVENQSNTGIDSETQHFNKSSVDIPDSTKNVIDDVSNVTEQSSPSFSAKNDNLPSKSIEPSEKDNEELGKQTTNGKDDENTNKDDSSVEVVNEVGTSVEVTVDAIQTENQEGADAEICIIPDTQREISQAEKDAASSIPPLRDLSEASTGVKETEVADDPTTREPNSEAQIQIFNYDKDDLQTCKQCKLKRKIMFYYNKNETEISYICNEHCLKKCKESETTSSVANRDELSLRVKNFIAPGTNKDQTKLSFVRKCGSCKQTIENIDTNLTWEIMDFCNEFCLTKYQKEIGSHCASCQSEVKSNSLGKYCVRFGNDIRQFCTSACLEKYKKGLKVCSYCQHDMSGGTDGFLAPVGDKGQFKDFCSQHCMEKYDIMTNDRPPNVPNGTICSVCKADTPITIEYDIEGKKHYCCREPCFVAFRFVNNISSGTCAMCKRHFPKSQLEEHVMYYDNTQHSFCSDSCENIYIIAHRKIVPCSWCKVKKYNFDMIRRYQTDGPVINMCSINCLNLYKVSLNAVASKQTPCNFCQKMNHPMYHLTMSDATVRNFCCYSCVMSFQAQFNKQPIVINNLQEPFPVPTGAPRKNKRHPGAADNGPQHTDISSQLPIITSVQSLATNGNIGPQKTVAQNLNPINTRTTRSKAATVVSPMLNSNTQIVNSYADLPVQVQIKQHFIVRPAPLPEQRNVGTMCYTKKATKSVTAKPEMIDQAVQTDEKEASKVIIPIPMPIYVPTPMHMFSHPCPVPVPIPIPIPVPVFIPTTSNSAAGIMKQIKKLQVIPSDPYEAEILMMAEMVAEEKKEDTTDSESDVEDTAGPEDSYSPEPVDAGNTFGDDVLQMALKMASELDEPAVDLEGALTANTITAPQGGEAHVQEENVDDPQPMHHPMIADRSPSIRGRKRGMRTPRGASKRGRRMSHQVDMPMMQHQIQQPTQPAEPIEKPDANMCLKFTFGVNAWKQWVTTKNTELEKQRRVKLFKTEILQLTADELNYSLCLFVKEVRKPNGAEYAPDTIYYLCLGIQQYLFENGRIDNIFCDPYYEKFTDCLDEVAKKFSILYNDSHYIVTRVEEEHLWESKQLGAHSPHVLLSTLMFFNTKHFNLTTVDEHMQLSFSHIMKHWKRNPNQPGAAKVPGSRNVLLRFYPPQSAIQNNARKKKVYEQQENEENPLRCPVKLYEFYLSKCPESVKTRNDVFYLQPERSCIPDSPVWYSTMPLPKEALEKMLHRVKMVKEINVALLTS